MKLLTDKVMGEKVHGVRIVSLVFKLILITIVLLLVSNFASNYINLMLNRGELLNLMNQLLVKDLKELHIFSMNQHEIYQYNQDLDKAVHNIRESALRELKGNKSVALGIDSEGGIFFLAAKTVQMEQFKDQKALSTLNQALEEGNQEGSVFFTHDGDRFFGVYKYNPDWDVFFIRAEEESEFYQESWNIFKNIALVIAFITVVCALIGAFLIRYMLRFVPVITSSLLQMQNNQQIGLIDLEKAPNDDLTFLGMSFNALASSIDSLMNIFKKFVAQDIARRAYEEHEVRLEGTPKDLTVLFTDIKGFTFMTETLGTDIINLLNMHYEKAIYHIHRHGGIIGSIIGDALLAVYGNISSSTGGGKSLEAIRSAYKIQEVAAKLREEMAKRKEELVKKRGALTELEEKVYFAVLLEVGVGIDGGQVFYGNIGSNERMTNTVIGDNVNSSSRLEGLTRVYKVPIICSEYVKDEVEAETEEYFFIELDIVQVKGKTEGKKVFWPIERKIIDEEMQQDIDLFRQGLHDYYEGNWKKAARAFHKCTLPLAEVFRERTENHQCPEGWNGIWTMKTK